MLDVLRQYYLQQEPVSRSKVYRASSFIQLGGNEEKADGAGL